MPEVVAVLIRWRGLLCPALLPSRPSAKRNGEAEVHLFPEMWAAGWKQHKECRGRISQTLCHATEAAAHFFLWRRKLFSSSDRRFPWVETTGYNFVFLLEDQYFSLEIWQQHWSLYLGISHFWYVHVDGLSLNIWKWFECVTEDMI